MGRPLDNSLGSHNVTGVGSCVKWPLFKGNPLLLRSCQKREEREESRTAWGGVPKGSSTTAAPSPWRFPFCRQTLSSLLLPQCTFVVPLSLAYPRSLLSSPLAAPLAVPAVRPHHLTSGRQQAEGALFCCSSGPAISLGESRQRAQVVSCVCGLAVAW